MDCKIIKFFLLVFFISFKSYAVEFNGKFIQGHYIIGKADPNSTVMIDKKKIYPNVKYTDDLEKLCSQIISIPASNTSRIQEMHIMFGQMLCNAIEYKLGLSPLIKEEE